MSTNTIDAIEINPEVTATASIIWMHGLGAAGDDFLPLPEQLNLPKKHSIRFIFPNAPIKPITINNGLQMRAWYDIKCFNSLCFNPNDPENHEGIIESQRIINNLINREIEQNILATRIILTGFSQGGAMALHTGLRFNQSLGGIICLSGYLPWMDLLIDQRSLANQNTHIFMSHGLFDPIIPFHLAKQSCDFLKSLNYNINWHNYPMQHTIIEKEIIDIGNFVKKTLGYKS